MKIVKTEPGKMSPGEPISGNSSKVSPGKTIAFEGIPHENGNAIRKLIGQESRPVDALATALSADIDRVDDTDIQRNLIRAAIRISNSKSERTALRDKFAGRGKPISAKLFDEYAEECKLVGKGNVPSGPPGHATFYVDQGQKALMAVSRDNEPYPIVAAKDFRVVETIHIRDITADREVGGPTGSAYVTEYTSPDDIVTRAEIPFDDLTEFRKPEFPKTTGMSTYLAPGRVKSLANAIASLGQKAPRTIGIDGTGPLAIGDGRYVFLRQGKPALTESGIDAEYRAIISERHKGMEALDIGDPSNIATELSDFQDYLRIGDTTPEQPYIALSILGALAWAPCGPVPGFGNTCLLIYGDSGLLKTATVGIAIAAQSSRNLHLGPGKDIPVQIKMRHNQSTTFGADNALYHLGGTLALIDDLFAGSQSAGQIAQTYVRLSGIADNIATGEGGTRGRPQSSSGQGLSYGRYPRASAVFTGEALPDEQSHVSETSRIAIVKMEIPADKEVLSDLQILSHGPSLSRAHARLIQVSLPSFDRHRKAYEIANQVVNSWELGGHLRPIEQWKRILAGHYVLSARLGELMELDPREYGDSIADEIRHAASQQVTRSGIRKGQDVTRDPIRLFVKNMRLVLKEHGEFLAAPDMGAGGYEAPRIDGFTPGAIGWKSAGRDAWIPANGTPVGAVITFKGKGPRPPEGYEIQAFITKTGWGDLYKTVANYTLANDGWALPSEDSMLSKLIQFGYVLDGEGRATIFGDRPRGYRFRIMAILRGEIPGDDSGNAPDSGGDDSGDGDNGEPVNPGTLPGIDPPETEQSSGLETDSKKRRGVTTVHESTEMDSQSAGVIGTTKSGTAIYFSPESGRDPVSIESPKSLAECYRTGRRFRVTELWIHESAMRSMGIPSVKERGDVPGGMPVRSDWANLPNDLGREQKYQGAISGWMPVWRTDLPNRDDSEVSVIIPAYDTRADFDTAKTPQDLITAIELYNAALPKGIRYRWSPNFTMKRLARSVAPKFRNPARAIIAGEISAIEQCSRLLGLDWNRELSSEEKDCNGLLTLDRNAAELGGFSTDYIGNGEPEHVTGPVEFKRGTAGYYRLASQVTGYDKRLPEIFVRPGSDGSLWVTGPDAELLKSLEILPEITEAYIWPDSGRYMSGMYKALRSGREVLEKTRETPAGKIARSTFSQSWHSFIGEMASNDGPRNDSDNNYRPDIRAALQAETYARMYRELKRIGESSGRYPVSTHVDAATYAANGSEDIPEGMRTDGNVGSFKFESYKGRR